MMKLFVITLVACVAMISFVSTKAGPKPKIEAIGQLAKAGPKPKIEAIGQLAKAGPKPKIDITKAGPKPKIEA